ncbi:MAG: hypothetical protein Q8Q90_03410 [bacterium]|nr:hypothetical protein [bacterium]
MKTRFALFLAIFLLPVITLAEEGGDHSLDDRVPQQMTRSSDGEKTIWDLVRYDSHSFRGFSLGKATGLPIEEQNRFVRVIAEAKPDQVIFVQGIADNNPWHNRAESEFRRLDFGVAMERARWAADKARESFPEVSRRIKLLTPADAHDRRGLNIYIATYERKEKIGNPFKFPRFKVGVFTGISFLSVGRMNFFVPTAGLLLKSGPWEAGFFGGWRPTSRQKDGLGERAESLVGAEIVLRDGEWFGYSAGVNTAWETLLDHEQKYVNRATGFYTGPKFFANANNFIFNAGANVQVLNLDRFGRNDSWWKKGYGLSFQIQRFFN